MQGPPPFRGARRHPDKPIEEHLEDWKRDLAARGRTTKETLQVTALARKVLVEMCGYNSIAQISATTVQTRVADTVRDAWGRSPKTCNDYLKASQQLCRWLNRSGRIDRNPLVSLELYNPSIDIRRPRRAITREEFLRLLAATEAGPTRGRMRGADRAMFYAMAAFTGLRRGELASLTPESFDLDAGEVVVQAAYSKRRRQDAVPLREDLVARLRPWLAAKRPVRPVFSLPDRTCKMLRDDLAALSPPIPYQDDCGRYFDIHSLRHTFLTWLGQQAPMRVAQELARHSDPRLTARYMHPSLHDQEAALRALPGLGPCRPAEELLMRATGTDGPPGRRGLADGEATVEEPKKGDGSGSDKPRFRERNPTPCRIAPPAPYIVPNNVTITPYTGDAIPLAGEGSTTGQ